MIEGSPAFEDVIVTNEQVMSEKSDRFLPVSILIAAVLVGGAIVFATLYRPSGGVQGTGSPNVPAGSGKIGVPTPAAVMSLGPRDVVLGNANAPVTVIEYGDYQCPYCAMFFTQVEPTLKSNYIDTGKVKFIFRDFAFLGPESSAAGAAAECALDQNAFWAYHDALYSAKIGDTQKGGREDDGFFNTKLFVQLAGNVGIDVAAFTSCVNNNTRVSTVTAEYTAAQGLGVNSTPTTFVNGKEVTDTNGASAGANSTAILGAVAAAVGK